MTTELTVSRRALLAAGGAGAGAVVLAACGSSSYGGGTSAGAPATSGAAPTSAALTSAASAASASASPAVATTGLTKLSDIAVGEAVAVTLPGGKDGIVARPTNGTAVAFSAICTHMGCTVKPAGKELHCPCHGSVYNATTGAVIQGPAPDPLAKVEVHVANGVVLAGAS